jgi:hypothetical protein
MDPLTAFIELVKALTEFAKTVIASQPPDVQAELWRLYLADLKELRAFFEQFHPKP